MSTRSRNDSQGKVLRSVQIGAGSMSPASILETKFAQAKASISQRATERKFGMTRLSPSSMPPYPAHKPRCVVVLVVSTFFFLFRHPIDKARYSALHKHRRGDVTFSVSVFHKFDLDVGMVRVVDVQDVVGMMPDAPRLAKLALVI